MPLVDKVDISPWYRSDHSVIELDKSLSKPSLEMSIFWGVTLHKALFPQEKMALRIKPSFEISFVFVSLYTKHFFPRR